MAKALKTFIRDTPLLREMALRVRALTYSIANSSPGLYTLCYHRVLPEQQRSFARQLDYLSELGDFVTADRAADLVKSSAILDRRYFLVSFDDGYLDNLSVALPVLKASSTPAILFLVSDWIDAPPKANRYGVSYMDRSAVAAWQSAGLDIGSHSATHRNLRHLSETEVTDELGRSRRDLEEMTGVSIRHFACPWGVANVDFDPARDVTLARRAGYRTFYTTRRGVALGPDDLMLMPRHVLEPNWGLYQVDALMGGRARDAR